MKFTTNYKTVKTRYKTPLLCKRFLQLLFFVYTDATLAPRTDTKSKRGFEKPLFECATPPAEDGEDLRASLGFCLFFERLLAFMITAHPKHSISDLACILSEEPEYATDNTETLKSKFF